MNAAVAAPRCFACAMDGTFVLADGRRACGPHLKQRVKERLGDLEPPAEKVPKVQPVSVAARVDRARSLPCAKCGAAAGNLCTATGAAMRKGTPMQAVHRARLVASWSVAP